MTASARRELVDHLRIMRVDHWIKNVFVLPGLLVALTVAPHELTPSLLARAIFGFLALGLVSSSNYVLNEILDAPFDREHPRKRERPVAADRVDRRLAYAQWVALAVIGLGLGLLVSRAFAAVLLALWIMGCAYNLPPIRSKDVAYLDIVSEAVNNPLRLLAGWAIVGLPLARVPVSLLLSYWMIGAYFMGLKRYAEFRNLTNTIEVRRYRPSLASYTEPRLLIVIIFAASAAMLFLGAFIMRYRMELILSFPLIALVMAVYLALAFKPESAVQAPEKLYREPALVAAVVACAALMATLLFVDLPVLYDVFQPTLPTPER